MLYLPKITPQDETKGIRLGNIFIPLSGEPPTPGQKGFYIRSGKNKFFLPMKENDDSPSQGQKGIYFSVANKKIFIPVISETSTGTEGLVFYAPLSAAKSTAETGQTLSTNGTVTYQTHKGIPCAYFNSAYITAPDSDLPEGSHDSTLSIWVCPAEERVKYASFMWYGTNSSANANFLSYTDNLEFNGGPHSIDCSSNIIPETDTWYHIAGVLKNGMYSLYINGELINSIDASAVNIIRKLLTIGRGGSVSLIYYGYLASARVYSIALSDAEILKLSQEFTPET